MSEERLEAESSTPETVSNDDSILQAKRYPNATRLSRLFAQVLDGLILMLATVPMMLVLNVGAGLDWELVMETGVLPLDQALLFTSIGIFVYVLVNGYHLWYFGQTLGKKMMQIAIVDQKDKVPAFAKIVGLRYVPFQLVGAIPGLALISVIDIFMIFRSDRRCLHDLAAGTRVIDVSGNQAKEEDTTIV